MWELHNQQRLSRRKGKAVTAMHHLERTENSLNNPAKWRFNQENCTPIVEPPENRQQGKIMKTRPAEEHKGSARLKIQHLKFWFRLLEHFSIEVSYCRGNPVTLLRHHCPFVHCTNVLEAHKHLILSQERTSGFLADQHMKSHLIFPHVKHKTWSNQMHNYFPAHKFH